MKTRNAIFQWGLLIIGLVMVFFPHLFGAGNYIVAGTFITTSVSWAGKENFDYMIKPMFVGKSPLETQGIRIIPNVQDKQLLNYFAPVAKMLKAYAVGFSGSAGVVYSQRTLNVFKMKAEASEDATVFFNTVFGQLLRKGNWNELTPAGQEAALYDVMTSLFMMGINSDIFRQFWLNDKNHEKLTTGIYNGTADTDYNAYDGMWALIFANAATSPSTTQIKRVAVTDGAVAQVSTVSVTGSSGTANVVFEGVTYLATFNSTLTQTNVDFLATHAANLLKRGITLTASVADLIFTATRPGQPFTAPTIANVSGNLAGTVAATTANTAPAALGAGESVDILTSLWNSAPGELKAVDKSQKAFYVGDLVYDNYLEYFEDKTGVESAIKATIDGIETLAFRGVPIIKIGWDYHLDSDFAHVAGSLWANPHRVIYAAMDNMILGIDGMNEFNSFESWFDQNTETNRMRFKCIMGPEYAHNKLMAVAY